MNEEWKNELLNQDTRNLTIKEEIIRLIKEDREMKDGTIYDDTCNMKVVNGRVSNDDQVYYSNGFLKAIENNTTIWNSAIDTMMEVIELQPLIAVSVKDRIKEIAKGLRK